MICGVFFALLALLIVACLRNSRRFISLALIGVLAITLVFPASSYAQFGILGGIQNLLNLINGTIRQALDSIGAITRTLQGLDQQFVWPVALTQQARGTITNLIGRFRSSLQGINAVSVQSATLPFTTSLETIARNHQTNDLSALADSYYRTFGPVAAATDADLLARNLIDADDAFALGTLKTLKASDQSGDLILQSGNRIEDEARQAAPGSAPFLTAASTTANIQSQAMMQKMLAAMIRQEAARIAHDNTRRKRQAMLLTKARQAVSGFLNR
jgi:hypothetical protein